MSTINPNKGTSEEVLRRLEEASYERIHNQLFEAIEQLLEDFEMTWDDLASKLGLKQGGDMFREYVGNNDLTLVELNKIAHVFSTEPYIIFRPRKPWTHS